MSFYKEDIKNIIIPQIVFTDRFHLIEVKPFFTEDSSTPKALILNENKDLMWGNLFDTIRGSNQISLKKQDGYLYIDCSISYLDDGKLKGTNLYCSDDRIGFGRKPLKTYKFDIAVPKNTLTTALHIGDGSFGFSMGNGTSQGFIPQIIGMGSDENDAGLYFIGRTGNNIKSDVPLIIFDGRNVNDGSLNNRPILGVTTGNYNDYKFIINNNGNTFTSGKSYVNDIIFNDDYTSLKNTIKLLEDRIKYLEDIILTNS